MNANFKIRKKNSQLGFTLLEVIISITILSTMMLLTTIAITRGLKARTKIQAEVDDVSGLRDSMRIIKADINMGFHHRDFESEILQLATKATAPSGGIVPGVSGNQNAPPGSPAPAASSTLPPRQTKRSDPVTDFVGTDNTMNFVTLNSGRLSSAVTQADFVEVGYALKSCSNLTTGKTSNCLYRRIQNIIDEDVKTGGNEIVMLENVSEFKLRFIADTKQDWVSAWDSRRASVDAGARGRFPESVEVSLSIERDFDGKPRTYSMQFVIPVHFPNNPANSSSSAGANNAPNNGQPGGKIDQ